ncbi:MAG TPA: BMP family ABC transporter substrate-binding protein [Acidimicrobiia bacterium]|nr:BMP family ABC transporter substrate-binding protein [Acidimicrobiia bacterium]
MRAKGLLRLGVLLTVFALVAAACGDDSATTTTAATTTTSVSAAGFKFGMILVGPQNDHGWSQAHFEAGQYLEQKTGATMIVLDKVNTADRPETTVDQVIDDMVAQGAQLIFATSDDMKDGVLVGAARHPDVPMIWSSGDNAWADGKDYRADLANLGNVMGRMEYTKMIAGCAAALTTDSSHLGYLGPLINDETRRLVNSAYLGANYCWHEYRGMTNDINFAVNWIGFWFNIPGFTLDPALVANDFFDSNVDVVISGIDTTEALVVAGQRASAGANVWAIPYDYKGACDEAPEACLGVPYFNWGPSYLGVLNSVVNGTFEASFDWFGPDWADINNVDTSGVGWLSGPALSADAQASLDLFIAGLADGSINLYTGPLNYQDGTPFLADGEVGTDFQIWYAEQLLQGIIGASSAG